MGCVRDMVGEEGAVFVKLNTRSPKDVPTYDFENKKLQAMIDERLDRIAFETLSTENEVRNAEVAAFVSASQDYLQVKNGAHAMDLLLRSMRVSEDLSKALKFDQKLWDVSLVFRQWISEVVSHPEGEFRCFVHKGRLNAVTQYYSFIVFDEVVQRKEELRKALQNFFDDKMKKIAHGSFVVMILVVC